MSAEPAIRLRSSSTASKRSNPAKQTPPPASLTPANGDGGFEPCAATASFLLYAQRNTILVLHHDTLAIERRFTSHREDVLWIKVDNASERGSGRLAVSFDAGKTAIVWDILTGAEVARFSSYEHMRVASFMRNGNIAFGNDQGNIVLFEPSTSEHISARTIFDPVTALAPSDDCRTFAIGYLNGSILVATLQPSFTILHTLTTNRAPSRINGLAWHGSSSKQKTDMLATQTSDGDLRVWSVPKISHHDLVPTIIRVLQRADAPASGPCWFAWSKNGRIVQYAEGETRSWDVRTKRVTYEIVPTPDGITAMANYGPTATLFVLARNHTVQQYDITPNKEPMLVSSKQHPPSTVPPTPPNVLEPPSPFQRLPESRHIPAGFEPSGVTDTESSADESAQLSPLQRIAKDLDSLDALESELRDKVMPLSPSSRASSLSSRSSRNRRQRKYLYDYPDTSSASSAAGLNGTEFSAVEPFRIGHETMSIRSSSSLTSRQRASNLRKEVMRSPDESKQYHAMDLFPFLKARLKTVDFRTPHYGAGPRTAELLQREMLSTVFGWHEDIQSLIRYELSQHRPGSASGVLLTKWLGDVGADSMTSLVGSEAMTSSDWMLLALSSIGKDSQKKVGEAFVQRLLEKGDIHPAVAILLGLGEINDAIEVYLSQSYHMEALLLTCLACPTDWRRQCHLLRKWGEVAVQQGQAELAVRCFSCTSMEMSEPWTSPRMQQEATFGIEQRAPASAEPLTSPPLSPPSRSGSLKFNAKNASLKLITDFNEKAPVAATASGPMSAKPQVPQPTPIADSALSPSSWRQSRQHSYRDPSSARTATPSDYGKRMRLPSRDAAERTRVDAGEFVTPRTASRDFAPSIDAKLTHGRRTASVSRTPATALRASSIDAFGEVPKQTPVSSADDLLARIRDQPRPRTQSQTSAGRLAVEILETKYLDQVSPAITTGSTNRSHGGAVSPAITNKSNKSRSIDEYISSVEEARSVARRERAHSRKRGESGRREQSRSRRGSSRTREATTPRGRESRENIRYIKPPKRSPSSPVPMSPEEIAKASLKAKAESEQETTDDEKFYKVASPMKTSASGDLKSPQVKSPVSRPPSRNAQLGTEEGNQAASDTLQLPEERGRGRTQARGLGAVERSPSVPIQGSQEKRAQDDDDELNSEGVRFRMRSVSASRRQENLQSRRAASREGRARSSSRRGEQREKVFGPSLAAGDLMRESIAEDQESIASGAASTRSKNSGLSRKELKELAARELEERRLSLARRPSAPNIPLPSELATRPGIGQRSMTDLAESPRSMMPPYSRSHTVDPESMSRYNAAHRIGAPLPPIGLPATPKAMKQPRFEERDSAPPVPEIPGTVSELSSVFSNGEGSMLSQTSSVAAPGPSQVSSSYLTGGPSQVSSVNPQSMTSVSSVSGVDQPVETSEVDSVGPLLPATTFGQPSPPPPPPRSSSVPLESASNPGYKPTVPQAGRLSRVVRKISPPDPQGIPLTPGSIDEAILSSEQQVIIVPETTNHESSNETVILPELQHLAMPPPPPPPPVIPYNTSLVSGLSRTSSDVISIGIDGNTSDVSSTLPTGTYPTSTPAQYPQPMERASTASPATHRRGRGSVSETFGVRFKGVSERMRSQSRSRAKSPPMESYKPAPYESVVPPLPSQPSKPMSPAELYRPAPYESVLPSVQSHAAHLRRESISGRAKSPYEQALEQGMQIPPPPPPPFPSDPKINETTIPPTSLPGSRTGSSTGYRHPKEIRANLPPEMLQRGVPNQNFL